MSRIEELRAALSDVSHLLDGKETQGVDGHTVNYIKRKIGRVLTLDSMKEDAATWTMEEVLEREG